MTLAAALIISATAMAQEVKKSERKTIDRTEMIQKRTEAVAKRYGLDEEQTKKLLELNKKYDGKAGGMMVRGDRRPMKGGMNARPRGMAKDSTMRKQGHLVTDSTMRKRPADIVKMRQEATETMQAYNKELQTIMTPEQYQKYEQDMKSRTKTGVNIQKSGKPNNKKAE